MPTPVRPRRRRWHSVAAIAAAWTAIAGPLSAAAVDTRAIAEQNLFDPQRKPWPDPAAQPPAVPAPGPEDIQVHGVVVVGPVKRALVKLGGRMRQLAPGVAGGRGMTVLREGQSVGSYTVESVEPQQVVFVSGGNRFPVKITRGVPREQLASAPVASVIQAPTPPAFEAAPQGAPPPAPAPPPPANPFLSAPALAPAPAPSAPAPVAPRASGPAPVAAQTPAAATTPGQTTAVAPPSTGMTLLEAIQAAEAARRAGQLQTPPVNPFLPRQ